MKHVKLESTRIFSSLKIPIKTRNKTNIELLLFLLYNRCCCMESKCAQTERTNLGGAS